MKLDDAIYLELLSTFGIELREQYDLLSAELLKLEAAETQQEKIDCIQVLFRCAHTIKGAAASVGIEEVKNHAHAMENIFSSWRDNQLSNCDHQHIAKCLEMADELLNLFGRFNQQFQVVTESLPVAINRIDTVNMKADELIGYHLRLANLADKLKYSTDTYPQDSSLQQCSEHANQLREDFEKSMISLQNELRLMRLIPLSNLVAVLERIVNEVSHELDKNVNFNVSGGDIEIDKYILEQIKDPMIQLIRNAIDHGIESKQQRLAEKKPEVGSIQLKILHQSARVQLQLHDDGAGIHCQLIRDKIKQLNLLDATEVDKLSDTECYQYIFTPGFTTAKSVSDISGRGVGLDVVQSAIEKVKGTVQVRSEQGVGTSFFLDLPLTLATTRGLFITVSNQQYMLPTISLVGLHSVDIESITYIDNTASYIIEEEALPIYFLDNILRLDEHDITGLSYHGIILQIRNHKILLLVDDIDCEHEAAVKSLPEPLSRSELFLGVAHGNNGELVPVLDPTVLLKLAHARQGPIKINHSIETQKQHILVVDDSYTLRHLVTNALRAQGYQVSLAADGEEAWNKIQTVVFDLIVTDILMPNVNGFELTARIKNSKQYRSLPVIVVSSSDSNEDKNKAAKVGADVYLVKNAFNTQLLIDAIQEQLQ